MSDIATKLTYLNTTKSQLKDMINYGLDDENKITSSTTFRNYVGSVFKAFLESLNNPSTLFNNLTKITGTGSNITLNDTANAPMRIMLNATDITQETNLYQNGLEQGSIYNGSETTGNNRVRTIGYIEIVPNTNIAITFGGVQEYTANYYNSSKEYITASNWTASGTDISVIPNAYYMRLTFRNSDNSAITPSSVTNLQVGKVPNPNYPQDIHTISGDNTIKVMGKNLFNKNKVNSFYGYPSPSQHKLYIQGTTDKSLYMEIQPNTKYTIQKVLSSRFYVGTCTAIVNQTPVLNAIANNSASSLTLTSGASDKYLVITYYLTGTDTLTEQEVLDSIQVELGNTATSYEPYISQEADIDLGTENLLKVNTTLIANRTATGLTTNLNYDKSINVVGTSSGTQRYWTSNDDNKQLFKAGTYTFFIECSDDRIECSLQTKGATSSTTSNKTTTNKKITFTYTEDFYVYNGIIQLTNSTAYSFNLKLYLVKGSEVQTMLDTPIDYSKIGNYEDKFIRTSGLNLFDKDSADIVTGYIDGTTGNVVLGGTSKVTREYISILPNTDMNISGFNNIVLAFYNKDKTFIERVLTASSSYTFNKNAYYIRIQGTGDTFNADAIMLNLGTTALPYEPYGSNEWYIKKNIGKVVLDGTESTWNVRQGSDTSLYVFYLVNNYVQNSIKESNSSLSNYFLVNNTPGLIQTDGTFRIAEYSLINRIYLCLKGTTASTTGELQTWLSTHNTTVYYVLATPTYTQITGTLETQLENVYQKLLSYDGTTSISQINADLPFTMSVQAIEK